MNFWSAHVTEFHLQFNLKNERNSLKILNWRKLEFR